MNMCLYLHTSSTPGCVDNDRRPVQPLQHRHTHTAKCWWPFSLSVAKEAQCMPAVSCDACEHQQAVSCLCCGAEEAVEYQGLVFAVNGLPVSCWCVLVVLALNECMQQNGVTNRMPALQGAGVMTGHCVCFCMC
jgi:hypothetical protein